MGIANILEDLLGSKVKKAMKIADVGLDAATGVLDASKGAIKSAAIAAMKERATALSREWLKKEYNIEVGKQGISSTALTAMANEALQLTPKLVLSDITDVRATRNEITRYAVDRLLEEIGAKNPSELLEKITIEARKKVGDEIKNLGDMVDVFTPSAEAIAVLQEYGEVKKIVSQIDPKIAEGNRERQARYRAKNRG